MTCFWFDEISLQFQACKTYNAHGGHTMYPISDNKYMMIIYCSYFEFKMRRTFYYDIAKNKIWQHNGVVMDRDMVSDARLF